MSHTYPSDITRNQFENIRHILESSRKSTRPRSVDLYDIFCGVLYVLKSGCQWRMLPKDYPNWSLCYYYFSIWNEKKDDNKFSIIELVLKKISCRNSYFRWSESENKLSYYRCTKCQKLGYSRKKGL